MDQLALYLPSFLLKFSRLLSLIILSPCHFWSFGLPNLNPPQKKTHLPKQEMASACPLSRSQSGIISHGHSERDALL